MGTSTTGLTHAVRAPLRRRATWMIAMVASFGCSAPSGPPIDASLDAIPVLSRAELAAVAVGDLLQLNLGGADARGEVALVEFDGSASFPTLGRCMALAGLSIEEITQRLAAQARTLGVTDPLSVQVLEAPRHVAVLGEVSRPGRYVLEADKELTLQGLLALSGGYERSSARLGSLVLVRWCPRTDTEISFTIDARPQQWTGDRTLVLQPHDVVFVPQTAVDQLNVWIRKTLILTLPLPQPFLFF